MHELETNEFRNLTHDSYYVQSALKYSRSILVNKQGYLHQKSLKNENPPNRIKEYFTSI